MRKATPNDAPRPGWWSRNWKWFVPFMCVCMTVFFCLGGILAITDAFGRLRHHPVYADALQRVRADQRVIAQLGQPIEPGWAHSGEVDDGRGQAAMVFNIAGPNGTGTVRLQARRADGAWRLDQLTVFTRTGVGESEIAVVGR